MIHKRFNFLIGVVLKILLPNNCFPYPLDIRWIMSHYEWSGLTVRKCPGVPLSCWLSQFCISHMLPLWFLSVVEKCINSKTHLEPCLITEEQLEPGPDGRLISTEERLQHIRGDDQQAPGELTSDDGRYYFPLFGKGDNPCCCCKDFFQRVTCLIL